MRLTRLRLRNYRVYEEPVDLEIPPGLVGIYGPNGGGKSYLVESLRWALYGRSRTTNEEVRTAEIKGDSVTEVEFEHEGHLYVVRRTLTGATCTVKASAHADGYQVAEGPRDTVRYVQSVLGMDDAAFRASVFAEQKQLAAFSLQPPAERKRLVLQLLGITPLDAARDTARRDARAAHDQVERLRALVADLDEARHAAAELGARATELEATVADLDQRAAAARQHLDAVARGHDELDVLRQEHELLTAEARSAQAEHDRALTAATRLAAELAALDEAAARLEELAPEAEGWRQVEAQLRLVEAVVAARALVEATPHAEAPDPPDEVGLEAARTAAESARGDLAGVEGRLEGAGAELERARHTLERAGELTGEADCPLCGQSLGDAFAEVQAHRAAELAEAQARVTELEGERSRRAAMVRAATDEVTARTRSLRAAREAWETHTRLAAERARAVRALAEAEAALGRTAGPDERAELAAQVERRRRAADECQRLRGRLERREPAAAELDVERLLVAEHEGRVSSIAEKLASLGYDARALAAARQVRHEARLATEEAVAQASAARMTLADARARAEAAARRLAEASEQHAQLAELGEEARHLGRVADLLHRFRNTQVAAVGPRLSVQAAELFAELTDHEYDRLEVDPDTYEIKVRDRGLLYGMSRFSGSETDLANLALRVAISEHVRFQSGGTVGLLVLDEVFGPLDDDRKSRMLLALERLRGRFRQVLVVTHDTAIKHQLPNAIEVVKLPGRRAIARLATAGA